MPSTSPKQAKFMRAAAHNMGFAKKAGIKQSVAKEFVQADSRSAANKKKTKGGKRAVKR